ncbi:MAG: PQQ-binding-like beta-propeller repeat protein [Emcibacter sp.]|nr:PQQ-binding-like beta-propeller repeat protein [Emcibacter sp.]
MYRFGGLIDFNCGSRRSNAGACGAVKSNRATGISWTDLLDFMRPSSGVSVGFLINRRNPHAVIRNPRTTDSDILAGTSLFIEHCAACHGGRGQGSVAAPALAGVTLKHGVSDWAVYSTIRNGVPNTAMAPHMFEGKELWQIVSFIRSINVTAISGKPKIKKSININVPYQELETLSHPAEDWLTYSGSYRSNRNSSLKEINKNNVHQLSLKWTHQFSQKYGRVETSPIVRKGIMYMTVPPNRLIALDALSGKRIWEFKHKAPKKATGGYAGVVNRGVAIMDDKIFLASSDAKLIALSANTGRKLWESVIEEDISLYGVTSAPLAYKDFIVTGISTKRGGRGVIVAYDINTGAEKWRFHAIPGPGKKGNETWSGDSWKSGGASTWLTGSYDVEHDILYWGVGNPKPDYIKSARMGDNLYSNSVVALRGSTGEILWHFQFSPGDNHDWDAAQIPVLVDHVLEGDSSGQERKLLLWANRNGFYYVLDRLTGEFIQATPFVHQTWAERIDDNGRPVLKTENLKSRDGVLVFPSNKGGTNWWSPSYDPNLGLMFVPTLETGMVFFPGMETNSPPIPAGPIYTAVRALNAFTGELVWEYRNEIRTKDNTTGGLLSTQGGIVFGSDMSEFFALDSQTGELLWSMNAGEKIEGTPVTFSRNGKQYVVVAAGGDMMTFGLPDHRIKSDGDLANQTE